MAIQSKRQKNGVVKNPFKTYDLATGGARAEEPVRESNARAKAAISASHARTAEVLESIGDAFCAVDSDFRFTSVNDKAEQLWGAPRALLLGRRMQDAFPEFVGSSSLARQLECMTDRTACRYETLSTVLGRWIEISVFPSGDGLSIYYRDISSRKAAEEAQRESETRFRQMANTVPNILWTASPCGSRDYFNQRWYDYTGLTFEDTRDWGWLSVVHEEDAAKMAATYRAAVDQDSEYADEFRLRRSDGEYRWHMARGAPVRNDAGDIVKWVGACTDISARKQAEQMHAALFEREHAIAMQLQEALLRPLPDITPGLALKEHYAAGLAKEAGVGGDFYDVFALGKGCTALVVGDVSGKGLKAASQVATVRNMLRAFLYSKPTLAAAVNDLNQALADYNLLEGFATLFVGAYDSETRILKYVNCGQEPALIKRIATGAVEYLMPTGSILGCLVGETFRELAVTLAPGDALAVFSDGLTEVGASRREMLGVEGVAALLCDDIILTHERNAEMVVEALVLRIIAGVNTAAEGSVMRDDVCLLGAVIK